MSISRKRDRSEGLDLSAFCSSFAEVLSKAALNGCKLYAVLVAHEPSEITEADFIASCKLVEAITEFEIYLLELGLAAATNNIVVSVSVVALLSNAARKNKIRKDVTHLIDAANVDLVSEIQKKEQFAKEFICSLIKEMLARNPFDAIVYLFESTDSCYTAMITNPKSTFNADDIAQIYKVLLGNLVREMRGIADLHNGAAKQKQIEQQEIRQNAVSVLTELGCTGHMLDELTEQVIKKPFQLKILSAAYNARLVKAVPDADEKRLFIQSLLESSQANLTKRQRLSLLPEQSQRVVFPMMEDELEPLEFLLFTLENHEDETMVLESVNANKAYFLSGADVGDCCKVVLPEFRFRVLCSLLQESTDAEYITVALGVLEAELIDQFLFFISRKWLENNTVSYVSLVNNTVEYSDLEKCLLRNLVHVDWNDAFKILKDLQAEHGTNYIVYVLSMLSKELVERYIHSRGVIFDGLSRSSTKTLFKMLWQQHVGEPGRKDEAMLDVLSELSQYDTWADGEQDYRQRAFVKSLNRYLAQLPQKLAIALIYSMQRVIDDSNDVVFIRALKLKKVFLKANYKRICSNFALTEFLDLTFRIVKAKHVIAAYKGALDYDDIATLADLVKKKSVTIQVVRSCVMRIYNLHVETVPLFSFSNSMNVFLILLSQYSKTDFKAIIKREFDNLVAIHGSFVNAVARFPVETRVGVLRHATQICPAAQINDLYARINTHEVGLDKVNAYVKRILSRVAKGFPSVYIDYLEAVFRSNEDCFIEYCNELPSLGNLAVSAYINCAATQAGRLKIVSALGRLINFDNFLPVIRDGLIHLTLQSANSLIFSISDPEVKLLIQAEKTDLRLMDVLYLDTRGQQAYLQACNIIPRDAFQLALLLDIVPIDQHHQMVESYLSYISSKAKREFVISHCHPDVRARVSNLLVRSQLPLADESCIKVLAGVNTLHDLAGVLNLTYKTCRFELVFEWLSMNAERLVDVRDENTLSAVCAILDMLPIHFQIYIALKFVPHISTANAAEMISSHIEAPRDKSAFMKSWRQFHGVSHSPAKSIGNSAFGVFAQQRGPNVLAEPESPQKKPRVRLFSMDDTNK